jgi:pullulanase
VQTPNSGFSGLQAYWIDQKTVAIQAQHFVASWRYALASGGTSIPLTPNPAGLTAAQAKQYPQLAGYAVFQISSSVAASTLRQTLKRQVVLTATDKNDAAKYLTGVQCAGVLDDLFYYSGPLGATFENNGVAIRVWAPTAQSAKLLLFDNEKDRTPAATVAMSEENGVWRAEGGSSWAEKYYLLSVRAYVPSLGQIVESIVTDPYSVDLAVNGAKTRITNLRSERNKPNGWDQHRSPYLLSKSDLSIYELHVRDFSAADESVPEQHRGTYLAITDSASNGMGHLRQLASAGLKAVHLLPTFHFASVSEDKSTWKSPGNLSGFPPQSQEQQAMVVAVQRSDGYNWGYDPVHYFAPEGSYAVDPGQRVKEYREMVMALHGAGLRVVQDVVFNHTNSSGQALNSVLDKIVPNYYYRLDTDGAVENSSCCPNTASEHKMMEKLMIDAGVHYAREYKIDGFRFDLMSLHFVYNMEHIRDALAKLTLENDGVDGAKIYIYGEGWNFGETRNNQLGPNADQANMCGTGIGTFNDRIRDAIRGGGPFDDQRLQGFATGLFTESSRYTNQQQTTAEQRTELMRQTDWIRAGLAGNLRDFVFETYTGQREKASQINYSGQGVGYTASPVENVNYCSAHDNQTLFDAVQLKSAVPGTTPSGGGDIAMRTRRQVLAISLIALGQGIPFFQAGDDLLRSKDMDNNSYDSGDWFNKIDFTYQSANWGIGLPIASENESNWPIMQPLLANPALTPDHRNINHARRAFTEFLRIRESSRLFRMETAAEVQNNLHLLNTGVDQQPGLIVMTLDGNGGIYGPYTHIAAVFNATTESITFQNDLLKRIGLHLHPVQMESHDPIVRKSAINNLTGAISVPALTTAIFVSDK